MFRGGPVDSRGTGITSGLGYENGGRVGFATGGDFFRKYILGPKTGGIGTQLQRDRALQSTLLPPGATEQDRFKMFADLVSEQETGSPITGDTGLAPSYLTGTEFYEQAYGSDPSAAEGLFASMDTVGAGKKVGEEEASELSIKPKTGIEKLDNITPVAKPKINTKDDPDEPEVTMTDLERALGLDRARREYAEDALAAASKAFFEGRGFEAIADAAQVKSKAPDIKRAAALEEFKMKGAKEIARLRAKNKTYAPGNAQKNFEFFVSQGIPEKEALNLSMKLARNFDAAFLERKDKGTVTAKDFDSLARSRNIDPLPDVDIETLTVGDVYYVPGQKSLVSVVLKEGKKDLLQTKY
tara:strand:+ start:41 stop:1105 length:1065 start_codon:yes stop_codon:yes gene_type:complete